ncbi:hypothetical protein CYMTET_12488 [Cymbomonas tetramitiformis]|uniref:Uncharacterized protein n=1 Tax=Cymbomonas tetramitiformis TaxID=36881 RepID=A0AAE0GKA3_9CHLO|nr:hypothetical protein CYMTET_12488 [Cymbomonas tetramitiformis]
MEEGAPILHQEPDLDIPIITKGNTDIGELVQPGEMEITGVIHKDQGGDGPPQPKQNSDPEDEEALMRRSTRRDARRNEKEPCRKLRKPGEKGRTTVDEEEEKTAEWRTGGTREVAMEEPDREMAGHMLEQRREWKEEDIHVIVLTEVKTTHRDMMNKFRDMGYTAVGTEVANAVERKGRNKQGLGEGWSPY